MRNPQTADNSEPFISGLSDAGHARPPSADVRTHSIGTTRESYDNCYKNRKLLKSRPGSESKAGPWPKSRTRQIDIDGRIGTRTEHGQRAGRERAVSPHENR
ncbi:hypothetical protein EVAR_77728_1 [Eumeta japonica]|uniref:Uncharacterized protein n=1 Tax=Eumeta variegata TaxID=151549 RepID=A0A4C1TDW0_EUMVA|nr:hypothetical protein EVAR_77728_1 [Eumeta japonica]